MICDQILGKIEEFETSGKTIETVEIEWSDASKKIHRKMTDAGREIGISMDDSILTRGLYEGDVIYADNALIIAVVTPPCEVIRIRIPEDHLSMTAKVCYEIGNRHAPLFYGEDNFSFVTPYNEPMLKMLERLHGITVQKDVRKLDFTKKISSTVHHHGPEGHHDGEGHYHE